MNWIKKEIEHLPIDIIDGDRGLNYPKLNEFYENEHCLFLNTSNVTLTGFNFTKCQFINIEKDEKLRKGKLKRNDVVLTTRGTLGNSGFYSENIVFENIRINSGMVLLRSKNTEELDPFYIYYSIRESNFQTQIANARSGSAQPQLPIGTLKKLTISKPPLATQRKIASILSAYDDLIENNLKRIKLLEESIRTHYKILMCQNDGSWELQKIEDAYEFSNGYAFYKNGYSEEGKTVIDLGNISESSNLIMTGKEKYVSELLYDDKKKFHLHKYDVIVAMTDMTSRLGILAKVALIDDSNKYILNQRVGRLRSRISYIDHCFLYASLSNEEFRNEMKTKAKGAVQIYFNTKDIIEYEVTLPPIKMIEDFSKVVRQSWPQLFKQRLSIYK